MIDKGRLDNAKEVYSREYLQPIHEEHNHRIMRSSMERISEEMPSGKTILEK